MKKLKLILFIMIMSPALFCQTLSPHVIASSGGYFTGGGNSLSWTLGETFTTTLSSTNNILTQGFQQPEVKIILVNLTTFLEGFYTGAGTQVATLYNMGYTGDPTATDTLVVNLWSVLHLANPNPDFSQKVILHTNGTAIASFRGVTPGSFYIALKHRNTIETWSATSVAINNSPITYNFSTSQASAYDGNLQNMFDGRFAMFSGDTNQDDVIESTDYSDMENAVVAILSGYVVTDITGDAVVESTDYSITENNVAAIVYKHRP